MFQGETAEAVRITADQALAGGILAACTGAAAPLIAAGVRHICPGRTVFFARWGFSHVALILLVVLLAGQLAAFSFLPEDAAQAGLLVQLAASAFVLGAPVALVFFWAGRLDPDGIACLGLRRTRTLRAVGAGLFAYFAVLPGIFGTLMLWPWLLERLGEVPEQQEYLVQLQDLGGTGLWVGILLATLVIPFAEEVLFRGFLQPLLVQNFRDLGGVVITAVLFAALHGQSAFLPIFVLALVLGGVMLRTQRLLAAYAIHVTHNGLTIWMTLLASSVEGDAAPAAGLVCGSLLHLP